MKNVLRSLSQGFLCLMLFAATGASAQNIRSVWYQDILATSALSKAAVVTNTLRTPAIDSWNITSNSSSSFQATTSCPNLPDTTGGGDGNWTEMWTQLGSINHGQYHGYRFKFNTTKALVSKELLDGLSDRIRIGVRVVGNRVACPQDKYSRGEIQVFAICAAEIKDSWYKEQWGKNFTKGGAGLSADTNYYDRTVYLDLQTRTCEGPLVLMLGMDRDQALWNISFLEVTLYDVE